MDDILGDLLQSPDPDERRQAIIALARRVNPEALTALAKIQENDPEPELRALAAKARRYINQQTQTMPVLKIDEAVRQNEINLKMVAKAKQLVDFARDSRQQGRRAEAIQYVMDAITINPALGKDAGFRQLAGHLLDMSQDEAIEALTDPDSRKVVENAIKKRKQLEAPTAFTENKTSKIALLVAMVLLIVAGYFFVSGGLFDRYRYYVKVWQIKNNPQALANGQEYFLYVPGGSPPADGWAMLVLLHGNGGTGDTMLQIDFMEIADRDRAILIAPNFNTYQDNPNTLQTTQLRYNLSAILESVKLRYPVNEQGAVLYGFSRGGMFATEFLSQYSTMIHSIVADGAPELFIPRTGTFFRPIFVVYGENDELAQFTGDQVDILRNLGYTVTYEIAPGAGHELTQPAIERVREMVRVVHSS